MQDENYNDGENGGPDRSSDAATDAAAAEQGSSGGPLLGPLLIDSIPGEEGGFPFAEAGQGLIMLGVIALMAGILAALLSAPSVDRGWEGAWYVPRGELLFVLPMSLAMLAAGAILYFLGRLDDVEPQED